MGTWEDYRQERDELLDAGHQIIVPTREYGRGKGRGLALERRTVGVWTVRDGRVVRIHFYSTIADALEAVGLSE
jgi:ketosteroid isomerase-like protein